MTVYIEIVFLSNLLIDAFICLLTVFFLKVRPQKCRLIICSVIGAIASSVYPIFASYGYVIKIITAIIIPILLVKHKKFKSYCACFAVFLLITAALGGIVLFISSVFGDSLSYQALTYGTFPMLISGAGLAIVMLLFTLKREVASVRRRNLLIKDVVIGNRNISLKCKAFYDSGNRVYTKNGERVVIVNEDVYNMLMPSPEESVTINTPVGNSGMKVTDVELEIYFDDGINKIYKAKAGKGMLGIGGTQIILHSDMTGDCL